MRLSFAFVNAKVRGMRSFLHEGDRLMALAALRSVGELISRLLPDDPITSTIEFERCLVVDHVKGLLRIQQYLHGAMARFYEWQLARYTLENIKVILRSASSGESAEDTRALLADLPPPLDLPLTQLVSVRSSPESMPALIASRELSVLLRDAVLAADGDPFVLESALDAGYLRALARSAHLLPRRHRRGAAELVACEIDHANVMLALRSRLNYDLDAEAVEPYFVQGGQRITAANWRALLADTSAERAAELLRMSVLQDESAARMQWRLARRLYRKATRTFRMSMFNFGVVAAFFYIKRAELADLLQVVGMLTYGLPAQDLRARLVTRRED